MKRLTKSEAMRLIERHKTAQWSAMHERCIVGNGGSGWRSTYKADGVPVMVIEVSSARDHSRVFAV